ncbi:MAG TPA: phosphate acyltransferase PlsX [Desulfobacteraceae bacterium]|nr:phosphate acyltransferase PlsX [Desulfobacteraceae bacterium]
MKVAVDAMGGDNSPRVVVQGVLKAVSESGVEAVLVGDERAVALELGGRQMPAGVGIHHCSEVVGMNEPPLKAVRTKRESSIRVAFELVKQGKADAVVSAGNSGAMLAAGILILGRVEGVERPGIASVFPGQKGPVVMMDVGANVDCRPFHLLQFGVLADAFCRACLGIDSPRVGLLNIGEEDGKGNEAVRHAGELFRNCALNFFGNVEGRGIFNSKVDAVICDGFVGNVALKLVEGVSEAIGGFLEGELSRSFQGKLSMLFGRRAFSGFFERYDYQAYGGAPLLGINGVAIVCHGGSSAKAIENAVKMAERYAASGVAEKTAGAVASFRK